MTLLKTINENFYSNVFEMAWTYFFNYPKYSFTFICNKHFSLNSKKKKSVIEPLGWAPRKEQQTSSAFILIYQQKITTVARVEIDNI